MQGDEIRALRRLQREQGLFSHVFMTERDGPMTPKVLASYRGSFVRSCFNCTVALTASMRSPPVAMA